MVNFLYCCRGGCDENKVRNGLIQNNLYCYESFPKNHSYPTNCYITSYKIKCYIPTFPNIVFRGTTWIYSHAWNGAKMNEGQKGDEKKENNS